MQIKNYIYPNPKDAGKIKMVVLRPDEVVITTRDGERLVYHKDEKATANPPRRFEGKRIVPARKET